MEIKEALQKRRTIRLFQQKPVPAELLRNMVEAARMASCASNLQRLRYVVVATPALVDDVLEKTAWAALVKPRRTPVNGVNGPAAFIAIASSAEPSPILHADAGAAIQSM